jgi:polyhydroxybutyrate depolymerase
MPAALSVLLTAAVFAASPPDRAADPVRREWTVGADRREALVFAPAAVKSQPAPVIFAFHGHGGTAKGIAERHAFQKLWPEAIVVYMQGLNTPGKLTDPEGKKTGWQSAPGEQSDRDLKFFDAVLKTLRDEYKVDDARIYATGHSNGGGFTYVLWAARGEVFAAVAPSASAAGRRMAEGIKPKPVMHIAGEKDELVKFEWQSRTMAGLRKLNGCADAGTQWAPHCTLYPSESGTPVVTCIHPGTHKFPDEAPALIVRFFREHRKK